MRLIATAGEGTVPMFANWRPVRCFGLLVCFLVIPAAQVRAFQQPDSAAVKPQIPDLKIEHYRLPNGLSVVLHEDHNAPKVALSVVYKVGSKDEKPGKTGLAHLFEHLMFHIGGSDRLLRNVSESEYASDQRRIETVSRDDVARVAKQVIKPERAVILVIGDKERIAGPLKTLPFVKSIRLLDRHGNPPPDRSPRP
jgi:hypothetical protein